MVGTSPEQPPRPPPRSHRVPSILLVVVAAICIGAGGAIVLDGATTDHLFPGTRIGGVHVGGGTLDDAEARLTRVLVDPLREPTRLAAGGAAVTLTPWELGLRIDIHGALRDTHARQQHLTLPARIWKRVAGDRANVPLDRFIEQGVLQRSLREAVGRIDRPVRDAQLEVKEGTLRVIPDQFGREVDVSGAAERIAEALRADSRRVDLPVRITQAAHRTEEFRKVIFIKTLENTLDLYEDGKIARSYRVATGTGGYPTPKGQFYITTMRRHPSWSNPGSDWALGMPAYIPPGRYNPLGTRAMNLSARGIRIHGTPLAYTIGRAASHGCIRMHMREAEELFEMVDVGTPVLVVRA